MSRVFEINPSVRWLLTPNKARNIFRSILSGDKGLRYYILYYKNNNNNNSDKPYIVVAVCLLVMLNQ